MTTAWERRDLPVLRAVAAIDDENLREWLAVGHGAGERLGVSLPDDEIHDSILVLRDAGYVEVDVKYDTGPGATFLGLRVTGRGQQVLGEWPLFAEIVSPLTMAALLERLAEEAPTEEESANARRAAAYVRSVGAVALRAAATATTSQLVRVALGLA